MEQFTMFFIPEVDAYEKIKPALIDILSLNGLEEEYLSIEEKKSYYSVYFDKSSVIVRIHSGRKPYIELPDQKKKIFGVKDYRRIPLSDLLDISLYQEDIRNSLESIIDGITKEFDCCHRFEECSNAKACTHPDKKFALLCGYRKILKNGHIFYGKNRNV